MQVKGIFQQLLSDFWPALTSGMLGTMIGISFGANIKGGLYGFLVYAFFTMLFAPVVAYFLAWWIDNKLVLIVAAALVSSFCYVLYYAFWVIIRQFAKTPIKMLEKFKDVFK